MIWHSVRVLLSFGMDTYYSRLSVKNRKNIAVKGPVIIALNHPNAFIDPVLFTFVAYPPKFYFLARGDVFKPGFITYFLEGLGIVPIFRIQDGGKEGLKKNDETYQRVYRMLGKNRKVIVFAEGLCIQERRLRPLKKGVSRMVFNAMEEIKNPDLIVVPVGVNYSDAKKFRSHLFYNIGEPIRVVDYMEAYKENPSRTLNAFLKILEPKMKELIVHIDNPENDELVSQLEKILWRDWCRKHRWDYKDPENEFKISKEITAIVNKADVEHKKTVESLKENCKVYFYNLDKMNIRDWLVNPHEISKVNWFYFSWRMVALIIFSPLWIRGLLGNYPPYKLSQYMVDKKIKHVEFHASFKLAIGSLLMWIYYGIQFGVIYSVTDNLGWACLAPVVSFFTGKFVLHYYPFLTKTMGMFRALTKMQQIKALRKQREEIVNLVAEINKN